MPCMPLRTKKSDVVVLCAPWAVSFGTGCDFLSEMSRVLSSFRNDLWESLRRLQDRLSAINEVNFIASDVFNKVKQHFQRIRIAHEMRSVLPPHAD